MAFSSRLAGAASRLIFTAADWGWRAGWHAAIASRWSGRKSFPIALTGSPFTYRGDIDHGVMSFFFVDFGFVDTRGGPPIRTVVDAGANIGCFSLLARRLYPEAKILALEIDSDNYSVLRGNVAGLGNADALHRALWTRSGKIAFVRGEGAQSHSVSETAGSGETVDAIDLKDLMSGYGLETIDLLKMDIEGAEGELLQSLDPEILARINAITFECNDSEMPGAAIRLVHAISPDEFDAYAFGENLCLIRRSTGWSFGRRYAGMGDIFQQSA